MAVNAVHDAYGPLKGGTLTIRGPVMAEQVDGNRFFPDGIRWMSPGTFVDAEAISDGTRVKFLALVSTNERNVAHGIILYRDEEKEQYRRIGFATIVWMSTLVNYGQVSVLLDHEYQEVIVCSPE